MQIAEVCFSPSDESHKVPPALLLCCSAITGTADADSYLGSRINANRNENETPRLGRTPFRIRVINASPHLFLYLVSAAENPLRHPYSSTSRPLILLRIHMYILYDFEHASFFRHSLSYTWHWQLNIRRTRKPSNLTKPKSCDVNHNGTLKTWCCSRSGHKLDLWGFELHANTTELNYAGKIRVSGWPCPPTGIRFL